jgi:hypothetical protein
MGRTPAEELDTLGHMIDLIGDVDAETTASARSSTST